jgi:hypothetical protein
VEKVTKENLSVAPSLEELEEVLAEELSKSDVAYDCGWQVFCDQNGAG